MILNNQVIAATLGLMNICMFLYSKCSLLLCYTFPPLSQLFFPAKYSTVFNLKQRNNEVTLHTLTSSSYKTLKGKLLALTHKNTNNFLWSGLCANSDQHRRRYMGKYLILLNLGKILVLTNTSNQLIATNVWLGRRNWNIRSVFSPLSPLLRSIKW